MNNRLNASSFNQNLHQPALEHSTDHESLFADLQPITDLTEWAASAHRVGTSATPDLRSPSTATPITQGSLKQKKSGQKLVPVPPELRRPNEDDNTRITPNALNKRMKAKTLVPVPREHRHHNENDDTRITSIALESRIRRRKSQLVPVPPDLRLPNEDNNTRISLNALTLRKHRKPKSAVPPGEARHPLHQSGETSTANTLVDSNNPSPNSQITASPRAGSNEPLMHATTQQDMSNAFEFPDPLYSDPAFSHWMDDLKTQQSAIDHLFIYQDQDAPDTGGPL